MVRVILPLAIDIQYSTFFFSLSFRAPLSFSLCLLHVNLQSFVCFYNLCHFRLLFVLAFETLTLLCVFVRSEYATDGIKEWQKWTSTESAWFTWPADKKYLHSYCLYSLRVSSFTIIRFLWCIVIHCMHYRLNSFSIRRIQETKLYVSSWIELKDEMKLFIAARKENN